MAIGAKPFIVEKKDGKIACLRGRANIDFPFDGDYDSLTGLYIDYEDQVREQEAAQNIL